MSHLARFARFWYDFIVGDDWTIALTVAVAVGATYGIAHRGGVAWWVLPAVVISSLGTSVARARRAAGTVPRRDD
jgi:hypothetical protein